MKWTVPDLCTAAQVTISLWCLDKGCPGITASFVHPAGYNPPPDSDICAGVCKCGKAVVIMADGTVQMRVP